jgi:hypothetical protein
MNVFEYFAEEEQHMEQSLAELIANYEIWSREQVFDAVKVICDSIKGHLKKQSILLLSKLEGSAQRTGLLDEARNDHDRIEEEIGQLVEVHVDEPNYDEYLRNLLKALKQHIAFSKRLYGGVQRSVSKPELDRLNEEFSNVILHSTDFNYLQAS